MYVHFQDPIPSQCSDNVEYPLHKGSEKGFRKRVIYGSRCYLGTAYLPIHDINWLKLWDDTRNYAA